MNEQQTIALCILRCARHKDGRGPWQAQRSCIAALVRAGDEPEVALAVAEAAARVGAVIAARALDWRMAAAL
jgi:hypothetical protein